MLSSSLIFTLFTGGVDTVDKMIFCYTCKPKTNRWPMVVFANIIDISALNAYIIFKEMNRNWQTTSLKSMRRVFLHDLGISLAKPYMASLAATTGSSTSLLTPLHQDPLASDDEIAPTPSPAPRETSPFPQLTPAQKRIKLVPPQIHKGRARCHICFADSTSISKNNMHRSICCLCRKAACKNTHNRNVCTKCFAEKLI